MDKLAMQTPNLTLENVEKIEKLFPSCIVESEDDEGNKIKKVDFDLLRAELGDKTTVEGLDERYRLDWPGKKRSILKANTPITKTLRPVKEDSVDWDTTQNLYIEGDNFEVLKVLQESYLGKIKMIYIDPPYNTGNDFVYNDDFSEDLEEYKERTEENNEGYKMIKNTESNGRFHSDWLSMMYERLRIARDLLTDDGVIFISIDDCEGDNLKKICDEIFGENNFIVQYVREKHKAPKNDNKYVTMNHEYILLYGKNKESFVIKKDERDEENKSKFSNEDNDPRGVWISGPLLAPTFSASSVFPIINPHGAEIYPPAGKCRSYSKDGIKRLLDDNRIWFGKDGNNVPRIKRFLFELPDGIVPRSILFHDTYGGNQKAANDLKKLFEGKKIFDYSKPVDLMKYFIDKSNGKDEIVLDFFSGSATTAHAVMQLNAEDGGNRKYIMVQLPELIDEQSEAYKAGYKNICEIGKERIRRAGKKIKEETGKKIKEETGKKIKEETGKKIKEETGADIDYGFRVYKLDESCMKDVYYHPSEAKQENLALFTSNIKEDRTPEDLLTQVILDLGLTLDLPIEEKAIGNNKVFYVAGNSLIACFDENIDDNVIDEIAKDEPIKLVFRDACFKDDAQRINVENKVKRVSPETIIKVI